MPVTPNILDLAAKMSGEQKRWLMGCLFHSAFLHSIASYRDALSLGVNPCGDAPNPARERVNAECRVSAAGWLQFVHGQSRALGLGVNALLERIDKTDRYVKEHTGLVIIPPMFRKGARGAYEYCKALKEGGDQ